MLSIPVAACRLLPFNWPSRTATSPNCLASSVSVTSRLLSEISWPFASEPKMCVKLVEESSTSGSEPKSILIAACPSSDVDKPVAVKLNTP